MVAILPQMREAMVRLDLEAAAQEQAAAQKLQTKTAAQEYFLAEITLAVMDLEDLAAAE